MTTKPKSKRKVREVKAIRPTFNGKITREKLDQYIDYHRQHFISYPPAWYFTPEQVKQFQALFQLYPYVGLNETAYGAFDYKGVKMFVIPLTKKKK